MVDFRVGARSQEQGKARADPSGADPVTEHQQTASGPATSRRADPHSTDHHPAEHQNKPTVELRGTENRRLLVLGHFRG